jgi:D-alanyl-D-alanine carboxypeptidase/D-alanyl-D-alanine-endopeptidase (penicillin-binding protein 4)
VSREDDHSPRHFAGKSGGGRDGAPGAGRPAADERRAGDRSGQSRSDGRPDGGAYGQPGASGRGRQAGDGRDDDQAPRPATASASASAGTPAPPPPDEPQATPRRRGRWVLPSVLALVAVGAGAAAVALDADPAAEAVGVDQVVATPVLSARRAPEAVAAPVADRRLDADLQGWLAASPANTCLVVSNEGREVFDHNPTAPVTGASTQKLITATGLLLALGPDATFRTDALAAAAPQGGVVAGDLFLVGGGPADLGTAAWLTMGPGTRERVVHDIDGLVSALAAAGVTRIDGGVVGDGSRFDDQRYQTSLAQRLIDQDQVGPIGGLMVNDGFAGFSPARTNADTVPAVDPAADAARVLTERLQANGITVAGAPRAGTAPEGAATVASLDSPPVSQIVAEMLTTSDNEAAEAALKEIGVATSGEGTWAAGVAGLTGLLEQAGVPIDGLRVADGSGLTIENQLTCRALVDVLTLEGSGPVVRAGLAVAGQTGTLAERWEGTEVAGRLRGKTGTLRNVTALAGAVEPTQGGSLTFAYVANVPDPGEVTAGEVGVDELAHILVQYPRGVDMAALSPLPATAAP